MSYNVAVAVEPIPSNEQDAWEWVNRMADLDNDSPPQVFHELIDTLTTRYPCICDLSDEIVDDQGVWSDGPLRNNITVMAPVLGIVYSKVDKVLPFLIETANLLELTVFDWSTEKIYRPLPSTSI